MQASLCNERYGARGGGAGGVTSSRGTGVQLRPGSCFAGFFLRDLLNIKLP